MGKKSSVTGVVLAGCDAPDYHPAHCKCYPVACVFCEIIRQKSGNDFKTHGYTAVSFIPLNPVVEGHRLFVPITHATDLSANPESGCTAFFHAARWAKEKGVPFNIITSGGKEATQTVFHTHIHYVPRSEGDGLLLPWSNQEIAKIYDGPTIDGEPYEPLDKEGNDRYPLFSAKKNCVHQIESQWSGYKCVKCSGWYCA